MGKGKENTFNPGRRCPVRGTCTVSLTCEHAQIIFHEIKTLQQFGPAALRSQVVGPKCHHPSEGPAIKAGKKALKDYTPPATSEPI
jgi:hypothetical protein